MIPLEWAELEELDLGALQGYASPITAIKADSRLVGPGDLFVALNTGVAFVDQAAARGAATLVPNDQHAALAALAALVRSKSDARVVAVVGSYGKTSTKDILGALCSAVTPTVWADASQNNEIGLPLTVLRLEPDTRVLVTEMGMRGLEQITELCAIARPDVVLVTSIGAEHLELVGTVENVARANAEAIEGLPPGGVAVVPADAPKLAPYLTRDDIDVRTFDRSTVRRDGDLWRFLIGATELTLALPFEQRHMAENTLAALTTYDALGLPLERAQDGAMRIALSRWRGEEILLPGGGVVVNDAYNANPASMRAALTDLSERDAGRRRVAILGEMAELGAAADSYHREVGKLLAELGFDVVVAVGEPARAYLDELDELETEQYWIPAASAFESIVDVLRPGDAILVKASRAVGLEGIPASIEKRAGAWSES